MSKQPSDVSNHHDVSRAVSPAGKDTNPKHSHPHESVPVRIAKESGFAAPGLDVPAAQSRPSRPAGTPQDYPLNKPIATENKSIIGAELGRGGTEGPRVAPAQATETYGDPAFPSKSYGREADVAHANSNFEDCSDLIMKPRGS
jgi:hypothetical protein